MKLSLVLTTTLAVLFSAPALAAAPAKQLASIDLPAKGGFADYMAIDGDHHRLYVGFTAHDMLVVIDMQTNKVVASIPNLPRVHTVAPVNGQGFSSNGGKNEVAVIDLATNQVTKRIPVGVGPDAIIYDAAAKLVYVGNHKGHTATVIDPATETAVATFPLGGTAEFPAADPETGLVYQNLEDVSQTVVVDPRAHKVTARYALAPGEGPSGLAYDPATHRLFAACDNRLLVVLDAQSGHVVTTLPIGDGVDFAAFDPGLKRIYTSNGKSATMTVIQQDAADTYHVLADVPTYKGGHALAVDPVTHRIYVVHGNQVTVYAAQ